MTTYTPIKPQHLHDTQYLRTQNTAETDDTQPAEPAKPASDEAK